MKKLILLSLLSLLAIVVKAQDIITLKNGTDIKAVVVEISADEIRYKKFENQDGPTYVVKKSEVFMITYKDGTREMITATNEPVNTKRNNGGLFGNSPNDDRIRYGGPRIGVTYLTEGTALSYISMQQTGDPSGSVAPFITQFGWQFETRFFTLANGASGLVEFVPLIGGMERGMFLPSASALVGFRTAKGNEFGMGPNLSRTGFAMVFAVGSSFTVGNVVFPVNLAYTPSVGKMQSGYVYNPSTQQYTYYNQRMETGHRFSLLIGFNTRKKSR